MSYNNGPITLVAGAAIAAKRLVKLDTGEAVLNTVDGDPIGVNDYAVGADENASVSTLLGHGTLEIMASEPVALDEDVYAAADGKVSGLSVVAGDYVKIGKALETASADGDIIEILPYMPGTVVTVT